MSSQNKREKKTFYLNYGNSTKDDVIAAVSKFKYVHTTNMAQTSY